MNNNKLKSMKAHCKKRCLERYGVELSNSMMKKITDKIKKGECNRCIQSKVYFVSLDSYRFRVVYDNTYDRLVTFLPNEQLKGGTANE
jgi:hypothetical protein